jgi:hypothetical protein
MKHYILAKQEGGTSEHGIPSILNSSRHSYCNTAKMTEQIQWFKRMHNLRQSVGINKQKMKSADVEVDIDLCPCCRQMPETQQQHMLLCDKKPNGQKP